MRCNLAEIVVRVSSYNDKPRTRRHTLRVTLAGTIDYTPFTPDKSHNNFLHAQTMASAILFESRTTILATVQHNWQCISWLLLVLQKNSMLEDTQMSRSKMGAFRYIHTCYPFRLVFE